MAVNDSKPAQPSTPAPDEPKAAAASGPRRRRVLAGGAAMAGIAAAGAAAVHLLRGERPVGPTADPTAAPPAAEGSFPDLRGDEELVAACRWAAQHHIQDGLPDGTYGAERAVTRSDVALSLHAFAGAPAVPVDTLPALVADLPEKSDRARALLWLHGRGALWGDEHLRVSPTVTATRADGATIIASLLRPGLIALGTHLDAANTDTEALPRRERDHVSSADVLWLLAAGVLRKADLSQWVSDAPLTRGELARLLRRTQSLLERSVD